MAVSRIWIPGVEVMEARLVRGVGSAWVEDWTQPPIRIFTIPWSSLQPENTREIREGAERVIIVTGWRLITKPPFINTRLKSKHRFKVPGYENLFMINGDPMFWEGVLPHMEVKIEQVGG